MSWSESRHSCCREDGLKGAIKEMNNIVDISGSTINFNRGVPAPEALPSDKIAESCKAILEEYGRVILQYHPVQGFVPLRELLADELGGKITEDQILVGNGSMQLLDFIARALLEAGDLVLVERPSYDRTITILSRAGAKVIGVPLNDDGIDMDSFESLIKKEKPKLFYVIPDFNNPSGVTTSEEKRHKILELAERHNFMMVEDAAYRKLRYYGEDEPSLWELNPNRVIYVSTFTKTLSPGIRVGWLAADPELMQKISRYAEDTYITPNMLSQGIVYEVMRNGDWLEAHIEYLKDLYRPRLDTMLESLERYLPEANWTEPQGGFFVGVQIPEDVDMAKLHDKSADAGLILSKSDNFFADRKAGQFIRLPFCAMGRAKIEEGVRRLANLCKVGKWRDEV